MATNRFLNAIDIIGADNDWLKHIDYHKINESQKEFLRSDMWEFQFIAPPACTYYPGNDYVAARLKAVSPQFPALFGGKIAATIRQFEIHQTGSVRSNGDITLTFQDREDQAMTAFVEDYAQKASDRDNRFSFRKEDLICECKLIIFNTSRIPVREYRMFGCIPTQGNFNEGNFGSEDAAEIGEVSLTLSFEHYKKFLLNV